MDVTGKIITVLPIQTGTSSRGEWKKQEIIIETSEQYPKKMCIVLWGDKINSSQLVQGAQLKVSFDMESREVNGRWFTNLTARNVELESGDSTTITVNNQNEDDLPF
jgi:hypothetical protein